MASFPRTSLGLTLVAGLLIAAGKPSPAEEPGALRVLQAGYPRAFFFRSAEGLAANPGVSYQRWEASFSRLMGIEGKVLDEEVPGRSIRNIEFFTRFKRQHPDQLVLLHYNGNARDPRFEIGPFFAGHFLYFNGAKILADVPAEEGETEIRVENPALFRTEIGRYRWSNDDIGLCTLDADGRPNWHESEQVQLLSIDPARKVLRVKRACYGTKPRALAAGKAYAAAHVSEGPWGRKSNLLWHYNYSTVCPRDAAGRTCAEVHCEELSRRFLPGGQLEAFDGLEFDVLHNHTGGGRGTLGVDCNADGQIDNGLFDGVNVYGVGVVEFCRRLREKLGAERLLLADGMNTRNQRAFEILNGIESEGWPSLSDWLIRDWSGGLNRHFFWSEHAYNPVFNYINHKFTMPGETPGSRKRPEIPFSTHRLVFAAGMFTDSAICYSFLPKKPPNAMIGIWDELQKGTEQKPGWLGRPLGPAVRLAQRQPDLFDSRGAPIRPELAARFTGQGLTFSLEEGRLRVSADEEPDRGAVEEATAQNAATSNREPGTLRFRLQGVPCDGPDLFVSITAEGEPLAGHPREMARLAWVGIAPPEGDLVRLDPPRTGMCVRGGEETGLDPASGASVRFLPERSLQEETHDCYMVHPPYKGSVGYTFWERDVPVPEGGRLDFFTGMGEKSPTRSDGVTFQVFAARVDRNDETSEGTLLFEHSQKESRWIHHEVSLDEWANSRVRLRFVSDCGPRDHSVTDHSHWGDVRVLGPGKSRPVTPPVRNMTWLGDREFTARFYFDDIRTRTVDLEWTVEGRAPIVIRSIRAHAHPDTIARRFERGLVVANPSPRPYRFDLESLMPGRTLRRLTGSPEQDPATNNGSPVGPSITLPPNDALFLTTVGDP